MSVYSYPDGGPPADLYVEGRGETLGEAFASVALAMFNTLSPLEGIKERETFTAEAEGHDMESLLFNIMDELLYINDTEGLMARSLEVEVDTEGFKAEATCRGERFDQGRHEPGIQVKAVTYHLMKIEELPEGWRVRMVFDT